MANAPSPALAAIDYDRIQALLNSEYVEEHFHAYIEGNDNDEWVTLELDDGEETEAFVVFDQHRIRVAVENFDSPAARNGHSDHRHYIFKLVDHETREYEVRYQPVEVDAEGEDTLDTFPIAEQSAAIQESAVKHFEALEAYIAAKDEQLTNIKASLPPAMILNVLGNMESFDALKSEFEEMAAAAFVDTYRLDPEFSELVNDDRMLRSYSACMDRTEPSMTDQDWENIENHTASAYFIVRNIFSERTRISVSMVTARCLGNLIDKGMITAAKIETAGLAHGLVRWRELITQMTDAVEQRDQKSMLLALYKMFVRKPISDDDKLYTCGMQNLGLPDFVIAFGEDAEPSEQEQIDSVARFEKAFLATFGLEEASEPLTPYKKRPDFGYKLGDLRHNPFGYTLIG